MNDKRAGELLASERKRIEEQLERLRPQDDQEQSHVEQSPGDMGSDMYEEEKDLGLTDSLEQELAAIERAEQRLAEGKYGLSVESGEPIPDARLEVVPWAERTVEEESRLGPS